MEVLTKNIDPIVEIYLSTIIAPFLQFHEKFYSKLNTSLRSLLNKHSPPVWFTANFITYTRTILVIPCLIVLGWNWYFIASMIVLFVDFNDFLDGVVARYWIDERKKKIPTERVGSRSDRPTEIPSLRSAQLSSSYGGFVDAVCDKAFVVPCWIHLLSSVPNTTAAFLQYIILWSLILAETASASVRFKAYFTSFGMSTPKVIGLDFSTSAVKADGVGKAKQTLEMVGTSLYIFPSYVPKFLGLCMLLAAVPLAYESVRRKIKKRVIYVTMKDNDGGSTISYETLKFLMCAKAIGSKLILGIPTKTTTKTDSTNTTSSSDDIMDVVTETAKSISCVDSILLYVPSSSSSIDISFLESHDIDYVACPMEENKNNNNVLPSNEVIEAKRCLLLSHDGLVAKPAESKGSTKKD